MPDTPPSSEPEAQAGHGDAPEEPAQVPPGLEDDRDTGRFEGVRWGDFVVGTLIGRGGMGAVYHGRQLSLERAVAIKVLPARLGRDETSRQRFLREAKAVAAISSPNVVQIYHAGSHLGHQFYVMELVQGNDLARRLQKGWRPESEEAVQLMLQAARGLAAAARLGIVHRDIKPANMLIGRDGTLKLTDFGLARTPDDHHHLTTVGTVMGTATYLSPEQARSQTCDQRSDLYALGVVFFETLTGRPPFVADDPHGVIFQHIHDPPPDPRTMVAGVDAGCCAVVRRLLAKDPAERYQTADELIADLERLHRHERPLAAGAAAPGWRRALPVVAGLAALGAGVFAWQRQHQPIPAAPGPEAAPAATSALPEPSATAPASLPAEPAPAATTAVTGPATAATAAASGPAVPEPTLPAEPATAPAASATAAEPATSPASQPAREGLVRQDQYGRSVQVLLAGEVFRLRECPGGAFHMGSPDEEEDRARDELLHQVSLSPFWIAETEVTQAQWAVLMGGNPSRFPGADHPVEQITRSEAQEFLRRLNETTAGLQARLPTEPEWEYACRAGSPTPFANGRPLATLGWYAGNSGGQTRPVRSFAPNGWGIFDMHGNVAEWTADGYGDYATAPAADPAPVLDGKPVIRGGSWDDDPDDCRCARRQAERKPGPKIGFRFVVPVLPEAWTGP